MQKVQTTGKYENSSKLYVFDKIYMHRKTMYLKISSGNGKRITTASIADNQVTFETGSQTVYDIFTEDKTNMLGRNAATIGPGKLWVSEYLVNNQERDLQGKTIWF